jgi:hypothetical protein
MIIFGRKFISLEGMFNMNPRYQFVVKIYLEKYVWLIHRNGEGVILGCD